MSSKLLLMKLPTCMKEQRVVFDPSYSVFKTKLLPTTCEGRPRPADYVKYAFDPEPTPSQSLQNIYTRLIPVMKFTLTLVKYNWKPLRC